MNHAINELEIKLQTLEHNEPIHRAEGNTEQADSCASKAVDIRQAITTLKFAETANGSIDAIAGYLYEGYSAAVGGLAFNGDPLPSWPEFSTDPGKQKQADAWRYVAYVVEPVLRPSGTSFEKSLTHLINCHSLDSASGTPDFLLAEFMGDCLKAFNTATLQRTNWFKSQVESNADLDEPLGTPQAACTDDVCESCQ